MLNSLPEHFFTSIEKAKLYLTLCWSVLPIWLKVSLVAAFFATFLATSAQLIFGRQKIKKWFRICLEYAFNIASSVNHNYGGVISASISGGALIGFGFSLASKLRGHHTVWLWITLSVSLYSALKKFLRTSNATGREFRVFFENRSGAAQALNIHNEKYPPVPKFGFNYRTSSVTMEFIEDILETHLDFLHKTLKLGFSFHGKDNYTASLLIYDSKKQQWHKWKTIYEKGVKSTKLRASSQWPLSRKDFKLHGDMYFKDRPRLFDIQQIPDHVYPAFLTIPLYFRRNGEDPHAFERKGELFGAMSYTNSNPETFTNLTADTFIKYFALEMAVLERLAFRIYRDYNF